MSKLNLKTRVITILFTLIPALAPAQDQVGPSTTVLQRIVIASGVRLRAAPEAGAPLVATLGIGTELTELKQTEQAEIIGALQDYWYRVRTSDGNEGWLFGAFTRTFATSQSSQAYLDLARERSRQSLSLAEWIDLSVWLDRIDLNPYPVSTRAELELIRLQAVQQALMTYNQASPEQQALAFEWLSDMMETGVAVQDEPSAEMRIPPRHFWDHHTAYYPLPISEAFAWVGADSPMLGECEGYPPCYLARLDESYGRYLKYHPNGEHRGTALTQIADFLDYIATLDMVPEDSRELYPMLDILDATMQRVETDTASARGKLQSLRRRIETVD